MREPGRRRILALRSVNLPTAEISMTRVTPITIALAMASAVALQQPYRQSVSGAGAVKRLMIDPETAVMYGGVSPAKSDYVLGW